MQKYRTVIKVKGHGPDIEPFDETIVLRDGRTIDIQDDLENSRTNLMQIDLRTGRQSPVSQGAEGHFPGQRRQYTRREREFVLAAVERGDWQAVADRYHITSERQVVEMAKRFQIYLESETAIEVAAK